MSFTADIAAAAAAASRARVQMAVAVKIARMNADAERSVAALIEAAGANMQKMAQAALPPGLGTELDISV